MDEYANFLEFATRRIDTIRRRVAARYKVQPGQVHLKLRVEPAPYRQIPIDVSVNTSPTSIAVVAPEYIHVPYTLNAGMARELLLAHIRMNS